ncbi:putative zinc-finger-containing protein [Roridomyces roridus]|uniref:Zinc-finger-containing protein n=1 Tax=Roridomyces roridus TaxID=1738132 RepID=A0AAD7BVM8_9AGAR|nr:putative zinc-finger-containing protein [Roridomyces roridus]
MATTNATSSSTDFAIKYCSLCDAYFYSMDMLKAHIQSSSKHPKCSDCNMRFLNGNSRRNHYVLSPRHNFCRICDSHFKTAAGVRIHLEHAHDDTDDEDDASRPAGWEDRLALAQEASALKEAEIPIPQEDLVHKEPVKKNKLQKSSGVLRPTCPICLSARKKMSATRCGHVFCHSCISHVLTETKACPNCRQEALVGQLRTLDLCTYSSV